MTANKIFALPKKASRKRFDLQEMLRARQDEAEQGSGQRTAQRRKLGAGEPLAGKRRFALRRSKKMRSEQSGKRERARVFRAEGETATEANQQVIAPAPMFDEPQTEK